MLNKPNDVMVDGLRRQIGADALIVVAGEETENSGEYATALAIKGITPQQALIILRAAVANIEAEIN